MKEKLEKLSVPQTAALDPLDPRLLAAATRIDEIAGAAMELFKQGGSFAVELSIAASIQQMRDMLTPEIMAPIMALMNTPLGFRTDRDPKQIDPKTNQPYIPYGHVVVRESFIESKLRGFHCCGNEWNIIAGQFYGCKAGFRRKLTDRKTFPDLTEVRDFYEVPRLVADKGAIVKCRATWKRNGQPDSIECELPIKVNAFMGSDAILGKAERKLLRRVHDRLLGNTTPEGEAGEEIDVTPGASQTSTATPGPRPFAAEADSATPAENKPPAENKQSQLFPGPDSETPPKPNDRLLAHSLSPASETERVFCSQELGDLLSGHGVSFDVFRGWLIQTGRMGEHIANATGSFEDLAEGFCKALLNELASRGPKSGLGRCLALHATNEPAQ